MRAIFEKSHQLKVKEQFIVNDDRCHHLNVVRTRAGDEVWIFDGAGNAFQTKVLSITKKEALLEIVDSKYKANDQKLVLFIGVPKKDAFEDILKIAVECGFTHIVPLSTAHSQFEHVLSERINKIIESALVQSNNYYWPTIYPQTKIQDINSLDINLEIALLFSSFSEGKNDDVAKQNWRAAGVFIGPEAGYSVEEEAQILASKYKALRKHLPCPILRAPTAVAVSAGYIYSQRQK